MKYEIDSQKVQERALELGRTSAEVALGAGVSRDTMAAIYRGDTRQYTERVVMGLSRALGLDVKAFAEMIL